MNNQDLIRNIRRMGHQKTSRVHLGYGVPSSKEGGDGEFRLHMTGNGLKLYAKYNGKWYSFSPDLTENSDFTTSDGLIADNGTLTMPSGFMMQWGSFAAGAGGDITITFAREFPRKCFSVWFTGYKPGAGAEDLSTGLRTIPSTTSFQVSYEDDWTTIYWLAIGN